MKKLVFITFFLSGLASLIYQVTWARKISLIIGTDVHTVSSILAVFFLGLGFGSYLFGRRFIERFNSLLLYGLLQFTVGIYALLTPFMFRGIEAFGRGLWQKVVLNYDGFDPIAIILSIIILFPPTVLIGGLYPVAIRVLRVYLGESDNFFGSSSLYAINLIGSVLGAFLAGFVLIRFFGVNETIWLASSVNLIGGLVFILLSGLSKYTERPVPGNKEDDKYNILRSPDSIVAIYSFAGFAGVGLEVLFTRLFTITVGGSTYAFTIVLVSYLLGISIGSAIMTGFLSRIKNALLYFAVTEITLALSVFLLVSIWGKAPLFFLSVYDTYNRSFAGLQFGTTVFIFGFLLIPTFLMGVSFPLALESLKRNFGGRSEDGAGKLFASNTIGGVMGALVTGFILVPQIGTQKAFYVLSLVYLLVGLLLALKMKIKVIYGVGLFATLLLLAYIISSKSQWENSLFYSGFYVNPDQYVNKTESELLENTKKEELVYSSEGISGYITVRKNKNRHLSLQINGKTDASTDDDMENQVLSGLLPVFFHDNPKDVLVIGLGSGVTLGSVLSYPVHKVDVVEIERQILGAARIFNSVNNSAMDDPRVNIVVGDARKYLVSSSKKYDIISSEPSNPWISGSSKLFTKEYFDLLKSVMKKDGTVVHWVNMYAIDTNGLKSVIAAFEKVFPEFYIYGVPSSNDLLLIGADKPIDFSSQRTDKLFADEKIKKELDKADIKNKIELLSGFYINGKTSNIISSEKPNTDNYPFLEFSAPEFLYKVTHDNIWRFLMDNISPLKSIISGGYSSESIYGIEELRQNRLLTQIFFIEGNWNELISYSEKGLKHDSTDEFLKRSLSRAYFELGSNSLNSREYHRAISEFTKSLIHMESVESYVNLAMGQEEVGNYQEAKEALVSAIKMEGNLEDLYIKLGQVNEKLGDLNDAIEALEKALSVNPKNKETLLQLGNLYLLREDYSLAEIKLNKALELDSGYKEAYALLKKIKERE